jgi:cysteine-rich repeat protein
VTSGEYCDDSNTVNSDGCSSLCQVETNFNCVGQPSICTISINYYITFKSLSVSPSICNRISIQFTMDPVYSSYNNADFALMLSFFSSSNLLYYSWAYSDGVVTYTFDYTATMSNQTVDFYFAPAALGLNETSTVPIITASALLLSNNNLALVYYD